MGTSYTHLYTVLKQTSPNSFDRSSSSNLVFYAQSTIAVISGRNTFCYGTEIVKNEQFRYWFIFSNIVEVGALQALQPPTHEPRSHWSKAINQITRNVYRGKGGEE